MTKPFVGQGWANDIEPIPGTDATFCHTGEWDDDGIDYDYEDHPNLEYELEKAEYWADCFDSMFEDSFEALDDMRL